MDTEMAKKVKAKKVRKHATTTLPATPTKDRVIKSTTPDRVVTPTKVINPSPKGAKLVQFGMVPLLAKVLFSSNLMKTGTF